MAFTFGFYNSQNHDRMYDAKDMGRIFDGLLSDGVYGALGDRFRVKLSTLDNTLIIGSGRAWFDHTWSYNDADLPMTGPVSHILYPRWDAIVLDINSDINYRLNQILWLKGTPSSEPVKPTLVKSLEHNQYPICYIYRKPNVSIITESDIDYTVGTEECPYVEGLFTDTRNIAQVELNPSASKNYVLGEFILWNDELYKFTTGVSKGTTLIPYPNNNANLKRTTVMTELQQTFTVDRVPKSGSENAITSGAVYTALGNRTQITTQNPTANSNALITSGQVYAALGARTQITTQNPTANSNALITSGQVYNALGNRTQITTQNPTANSNALITSGQVYQALNTKLNLTGGTLTGDLVIDRRGAAPRVSAVNFLTLGNNIPSTMANSGGGEIILFDTSTSYSTSFLPSHLTANQTVWFPNKSGTFALTNYLKIATVTKTYAVSISSNVRQTFNSTYTITSNSFVAIAISGWQCPTGYYLEDIYSTISSDKLSYTIYGTLASKESGAVTKELTVKIHLLEIKKTY